MPEQKFIIKQTDSEMGGGYFKAFALGLTDNPKEAYPYTLEEVKKHFWPQLNKHEIALIPVDTPPVPTPAQQAMYLNLRDSLTDIGTALEAATERLEKLHNLMGV